MEEQDRSRVALSIHLGFGTIYRDGEFVQRGSVLGLAVDARKVVVAPVSGWVRLPSDPDCGDSIQIEIERIGSAS